MKGQKTVLFLSESSRKCVQYFAALICLCGRFTVPYLAAFAAGEYGPPATPDPPIGTPPGPSPVPAPPGTPTLVQVVQLVQVLKSKVKLD